MIRRSTVACGAALALTLPVSYGVANADDGMERETWGTCSGSSRWELKRQTTRSGGIKVEFEIDRAAAGSQWDYTVTGPAGEIASGLATADRDGEVEVKALTSGAIDDDYAALATSGDETCDSTVGAQVDDDSDDDYDDDRDDDYGQDDHSDDDSDSGSDDDRSDDDRRTRGGSGSVVSGYCDGSSSLTVATSRRGRTTLTIDSGRRGQKWNYSLKQGKKTVKKGVAKTRRGGSLVVTTRKKVTSPRATAVRVGDGERCATSRVS